MKTKQLILEAEGATVAFAFGRFNPAHQGHIEVWRTVEQAGKNWFIGTNPSTLGPNDPLTFQQKSAWMAEIYPPIQGHIVAEQSVLTLAAYIFKKLRKNEGATVAYITDDTDWAWSGKLLNQYNGVEGSHGYYKFAQITHVPSPRVSSATALRDAARADDKVAFYHASGTDPKAKVAGLTYFDTVKQACEKYPLPVKKAKKVKEEQDIAEGYGRYYCSTDKKWKERKGPKQTRQTSEAANPAQQAAIAIAKKKKKGVAEGSNNVGASIKALYQKIYNAGDDEIEYFYNDSPIFAQYWDEYEGDLDSIIAEVDPGELQVILDELESYAQQAGLAESEKSPMFKDAQKSDRIRSLKNLIAIAKEQGRQLRAQELELELKKMQGVAEMDKSSPQPGRDGRVSHSTYGSRDKGGSKGTERAARPITAKKAKQDALDILKKQGLAEEKQRLDAKCYKKQGTKMKGDTRVNNCVKESALDEKSVSKAQFRTMAAVANNPEFAKKVGISQEVGKEFHSADKNTNYKKLPKKVDEILDPTTMSANVLRYLGRKFATAFPWITTGAMGAGLAYSGLLAPIMASVGGAAATLTSLGAETALAAGVAGTYAAPSVIQVIKDLFAADENSIQAGIKRWVEKHVGDENDIQEFLNLHAQSAYLKQPVFRWRAEEWKTKMKPDEAEAYLEKHNKGWLDAEKQKVIDAEKAKAEKEKADAEKANVKPGVKPPVKPGFKPPVKPATESLDADQKRVGQVGSKDNARQIGQVLAKPTKQHPYKGRLVGEAEDQLDEIDRRGFLKGMGAAAVAGAVGSAKADWSGPFTQTDPMTDKVTRRWHNESTDKSTDLIIKDVDDNLGAILVGSGPWDWPRDRSAPVGRVRIDSQPAFNVMFAKPANRTDLAWISTYFDDRGDKAGPHPAQIKQMITNAKSRILVDVSGMSNKGILQFNVQQKTKESVEQDVSEDFNGEYDDEAGMARSNLLTTGRAVAGLLKIIQDQDNLPEWGQEKIAKAEMMLVSIWDYLQSQKEQGIDPKIESVSEAEQDFGADWDEIVKRVGQRAKQGPLKTVWDPEKRVYKNVPVNDPDQPAKEVDEASLATMRDYFAGNDDAKDPTKLAQMRDFFNKNKLPGAKVQDKRFASKQAYELWLQKNGLRDLSSK